MQNKQKILRKLRNIARKSIKSGKYKRAISAISACAQIEYEWNQTYKDDELEGYLSKLSKKVIKPKFVNATKTVLFYDGFGLNIRGLAIIYLKALAEIGYKLVYITGKNAKGKQSEVKRILENCDVKWLYYDNQDYMKQIEDMIAGFETYKPHVAFYYTTPYDAAAAIVFEGYAQNVERYLINLTDHAFWIGLNTFDYCIEFREYGASISNQCRGIDEKKLFMLPYYPYIRKETSFMGLPFIEEKQKFIFSGGNLYKTFGDSNATYYKILDKVLERSKNIVFLYAGCGNTSKLSEISDKHPNRVFIISERDDFYEIMKRCIIYINTYPIAGGLMTQYAALAGKIPITLSPADNMFDGVLLEQEKCQIEYLNEDVLIDDVIKLLEDDVYRLEREKLLCEAVIGEKEFNSELQNILFCKQSKFEFKIKEVKDQRFKEEFKARFNWKVISIQCIAERRKISLLLFFPMYFGMQTVDVIKRKLSSLGR